jgi:SPP1 gp7 family putative phage head morphogenesis protein
MITQANDKTLVFMDAAFNPTDEKSATLIKVIEKDGTVRFLTVKRDVSNLKSLFKGWTTISGRHVYIPDERVGAEDERGKPIIHQGMTAAEEASAVYEWRPGEWRADQVLTGVSTGERTMFYHQDGGLLVGSHDLTHAGLISAAGKAPEYEDQGAHIEWTLGRSGPGTLWISRADRTETIDAATNFFSRLVETGANKDVVVRIGGLTTTLGRLTHGKKGEIFNRIVKAIEAMRDLFFEPPIRKAMTKKKMKSIIAAFDSAKTDEYQRKIADAYLKGIQERVEDAEAEVGMGISFDVTHPDAIRYALEQSADLVKGINDTTRDDLREVLAEGLAEGKEIDDIADDISTVFDVAKGSRAETIARTETSSAYVWGSNRAYKDAGIEKKEWLLAPDYDPADDDGECEEFDGMIVNVEDDFNGEEPPLHPRCRCDIAAVDTEEAENEEGKSVKRYVSKYKDKDVRAARVEKLMRMREPTEREMRNRVIRLFQAQQNAVMRAVRSI